LGIFLWSIPRAQAGLGNFLLSVPGENVKNPNNHALIHLSRFITAASLRIVV
jgi:hypothetical protein